MSCASLSRHQISALTDIAGGLEPLTDRRCRLVSSIAIWVGPPLHCRKPKRQMASPGGVGDSASEGVACQLRPLRVTPALGLVFGFGTDTLRRSQNRSAIKLRRRTVAKAPGCGRGEKRLRLRSCRQRQSKRAGDQSKRARLLPLSCPFSSFFFAHFCPECKQPKPNQFGALCKYLACAVIISHRIYRNPWPPLPQPRKLLNGRDLVGVQIFVGQATHHQS